MGAVPQVEARKVRKGMVLREFMAQLAAELGFQPASRRLWFYDTLPNKSRRPCTLVPPDQDERRIADVGPLTSTLHTRRALPLDLWLGAPARPRGTTSPPPFSRRSDARGVCPDKGRLESRRRASPA